MGRVDDALASQKLVKQEEKGVTAFPDLLKQIGLTTEEPEPPKPDLEKASTLFGIPLQKPKPVEPEQETEPAAAPDAIKDEEKETEHAEPVPFAIPDDLKPIVGEGVETPDALFERVKALHAELEAERTANEEFAQFLETDPALKNILSDYLEYHESGGKKGRPLWEAFRVHAKIEDEIPDPEEDRDAYIRWVQQQEERKAQAKIEAERQRLEQERTEKLRAQAIAHAKNLRSNFQKEMKLTDAQMAEFENKMRALLSGDPSTGLLPNNVYHAMWKAVNYDNDLQSERARALEEQKRIEAEARAKAEERARKLKAGDGLPRFEGGKGGGTEKSQMKISPDLEPLVKIAFKQGRVDAALAERRQLHSR